MCKVVMLVCPHCRYRPYTFIFEFEVQVSTCLSYACVVRMRTQVIPNNHCNNCVVAHNTLKYLINSRSGMHQ